MMSKKISIPLFLLLTISLFCQAQDRKEFYLSPKGSDQNSGTEGAPFASIEKAKEMVKSYKKSNPDKAFTLILSEGTYYLDQPLVFSPEESGSKDAPYTIRAAQGEKVVISGGRSLDLKWKNFNEEILVAKVPKGLAFSSLFVNGEKQIRARYPNFQRDVYPFNGYAEDALSKERIRSWKHPEGGFIHALHTGRWGGMHYEITGKIGKDSLAYKGGWQNNRASAIHPTMRFVENIFEELDSPKEWYLDKEAGLLYYFLEEGLNKAGIEKVEVDVLENLITLQGELSKPVHHIFFQGITFTQTAPTFMKTEEKLMRSDWTIYRSGAVMMDGTENCTIENSVFSALGGNAIFISNYNRNVSIKDNLIEDIGASAISLVGDPDAVRSATFNYYEFVEEEDIDTIPGPKSLNYPSNSLIAGNLIRNIGQIEKQVAGVQIQMAMDLHVVHNTIYNVPRSGINIGDGAWGGHIIEYNDVFNTVMETGDHGAFNSWGRDRFWHPNRGVMNALVERHPDWIKLDAIKTTIIRNNRFQCDHGWDIDLDDGSSNYEIYNNLCLSGGIKLREGFYRTVYNNITVNNGFHPHVWFQNSHDVFTRNIVMTSHKQIQVNYWGDKVDENFFTAEADLNQSKGFGVEANGEFGNPEFINPDEGDFRVNEDSPAINSVGFVNFSVSDFGVLSPKLKTLAEEPEIPFLLLERSEKSDEIYVWHGFKVKNMETLGEQSAAGLDEISGVLILNVPGGYDASSSKSLKSGDVILGCWEDKVEDYLSLRKAEKGNIWKGRIELKVWRNQELISIVMEGK
ncbi:right-handed parallel beta-helix repeat-containing protein [Algoriphagus antarcticus]|uniref:Parallel beta helix pectate lyase-like protein n=1 Tax=Algoriphagus antarcticus TaxID=238540 RepID=A0A3E0DGY7_9BACT|nr:right-handed parallel beta-helix repeat-containing protein [Algoriphagus antarcticus]REG81849.1 parallel beta helix pectate lyase-like protein [Algoriphagus antarcticus]